MDLDNRSWEISTASSFETPITGRTLRRTGFWNAFTLNYYVLCHDFLNQNFLLVNPSATPLRFASIFMGFNFRLLLLHAKACLCPPPPLS